MKIWITKPTDTTFKVDLRRVEADFLPAFHKQARLFLGNSLADQVASSLAIRYEPLARCTSVSFEAHEEYRARYAAILSESIRVPAAAFTAAGEPVHRSAYMTPDDDRVRVYCDDPSTGKVFAESAGHLFTLICDRRCGDEVSMLRDLYEIGLLRKQAIYEEQLRELLTIRQWLFKKSGAPLDADLPLLLALVEEAIGNEAIRLEDRKASRTHR